MLLRVAIALMAFFIFSSQVSAVDLKWVHLDKQDILEVDGEIKSGDQALIAQSVSKQDNKESVYLAFNSPGGDLFEAVKIGQYIRSMNFNTVIGRGKVCYSACFFSFIGGITRQVSPTGKLGVHQFYGGKGTPGYVESTTQYFTAQLLDYTAKMGVNIETMKLAFKTPPQSMYVFSQDEIKNYFIEQLEPMKVIKTFKVLWEKDGWTVRLQDNVCQMNKKGSLSNMVFGVIVQKPYRGFVLYYYKPSSATALIFEGILDLALLFDENLIAKRKAEYGSQGSLHLMSIRITNSDYYNLAKANTLSFIIKDNLVEQIDLRGSADAMKQFSICTELLSY